MNNLKMVNAISRHYSQLDEIVRFLQRIANQLILRCKETINSDGKLWDQPKPQLVAKLRAAAHLHGAWMVSCCGHLGVMLFL